MIWLHCMYLIVLMCNYFFEFNRRVFSSFFSCIYSWYSWYCIHTIKIWEDVLNYGIMEMSSQHIVTSIIYLEYVLIAIKLCSQLPMISNECHSVDVTCIRPEHIMLSFFYLLFFWALPQHLTYYSCKFTIITSIINFQLTICIYNFKEHCMYYVQRVLHESC